MSTLTHFLQRAANCSKTLIRRMSILSSKQLILEHVGWFLDDRIGYEYGITREQKVDLIQRFQDNARNIEGASAWEEHLEMVAYLLQLSPSERGAVVECGCYKAQSTANLSLVQSR